MPAMPPDENELAVKARLVALIDGPGAAAASPSAQPQPQPQGRTAADTDGWWDALYADTTKVADAAGAEADGQPRMRTRTAGGIPPWWTGRHIDLTPAAENAKGEEAPRDADAQPTAGTGPDADAQPDGEAEPDADAQPDADDAEQPDTDAQPKRWRPQLRIPARRHFPHDYAAGPGALIAAPAPRMSLLDAYARIPHRVRWLALHGTAAAWGYHLGWVQFSTRTAAWIATHGWANVSTGVWIGCAIACELVRRRTRAYVLPVRWAAAIPIASIVTGALLYGAGWNHLELPL